MNEQAENYFIGIVFGVMIVGLGIGVVLGSVPILVLNIFDGLVIAIIGLVVMFVLKHIFLKAGYKIRIVKEGDEDET